MLSRYLMSPLGALALLMGCDSDPSTAAAPACAPSPSCEAGHECLNVKDHVGQPRFTLRMSRLSFTSPEALQRAEARSFIAGGINPNLPECNVGGLSLFSWLLQFDTEKQTLKTGVSKPVPSPTSSYQFVDENVRGRMERRFTSARSPSTA